MKKTIIFGITLIAIACFVLAYGVGYEAGHLNTKGNLMLTEKVQTQGWTLNGLTQKLEQCETNLERKPDYIMRIENYE